MKTFVVVFIALVAVAASGRVAAVAVPQYAPGLTPGRSLKLGTALKAAIAEKVQEIVGLVSSEILGLVSGGTPVPVQELLATLGRLPSVTVAGLLSTIGALLGKNLSAVLYILPKIVAETLINVINLVGILRASIPPAPTVPLKALLVVLGSYLDQLLVTVLVNLLDSLS